MAMNFGSYGHEGDGKDGMYNSMSPTQLRNAAALGDIRAEHVFAEWYGLENLAPPQMPTSPPMPTTNFPGRPALIAPNSPQETPMIRPALSDPMSAANRPNPGALTANLRGSQMPSQKIGMNEALIRMGGAVSGVPMLENLGSSYGEIQDYNRAREMEAFGIEEARRKAIQDRITASTKAAEASSMSSEEMIQAQTSYNQMQEALSALSSGNLTGPIAGRLGAWLDRSGLTDRYFGNEAGARRAYMRSILQNIQVDDTLLKTANTKGAISDKEMELFKSPLPKITDDEGVWKLYIQQRMDVLSKIMGSQGTSVSDQDYVIEPLS